MSIKQRQFYTTKHGWVDKPPRYRFIKVLRVVVTWFFPKMTINRPFGEEPQPVVYVANHAKANGPLSMVLRFDKPFRPWVIDEVCHEKTLPAFARMDFWHPKNPITKALTWVLSYIAALILPYIFRALEAIPAHFDRQAVESFERSARTLEEGKNVLIFPEKRAYHSPHIEELQDGFTYISRYYYHRTGQGLTFCPVYICGYDKTITVGQSISYDPHSQDSGFFEQKRHIVQFLQDELCRLAEEHDGPAEYHREDYQDIQKQ